jgi:PAS domain S-box-containing protein
MNLLRKPLSLRAKLVLASVVVEICMLTLLVSNSVRLMHERLLEQAQLRVAEMNVLLNAAVAGPLALRDYATLVDLLEESRRDRGIEYLVLQDHNGGPIIVAAGWDRKHALPPAKTRISPDDIEPGTRLDIQVPIGIAGHTLGRLQYGMSTEFLASARAHLLRQSLLIAGAEVALSVLLLALLGIWLTRNLGELSRAAHTVAEGNFDLRLTARSRDEVGTLVQAFNAMTERIRADRERLQGANADLTERNRQLAAEIEQRREAEQARDRLISVLEATPDLVGTSDPEGNITYINRAGRKMIGWGDRALADLHIPQVHPQWAARVVFEEGIPTAIRDGAWAGETAVLAPDGGEIPVSQVILSHRDAQGGVAYLSTIVRDISDRKRAEDEIRQLNTELERRVQARTTELVATNQELEAFAYSVSHDLRAPLRAVDGFSLALLEDYADKLDAAGRNYLERVRGGAQHMGRLIDDLLKLSRVTRTPLQPAAVDLSAIARDVAAHLREQSPGREARIDIAGGLNARGDPGLLRIVLENLLGNAWKYTSKTADARISFDAEQRDGEMVFRVRDNGTGFDMAHAGKLFGAFQRLHHRDEFEGTGIGLATVQRIIQRHGGRVWATAEPGRGACFYFTLRSAAAPA